MNKSIKKCFINGKWWYPYSVKHVDADGTTYSFTILAISKDHAACIVDDIRRTAELQGELN